MSADQKTPITNPEFNARMMAVQATYQTLQNAQDLRTLIEEYLTHRRDVRTVEGETLGTPDKALFRKILLALEARQEEVISILSAHAENRPEKQTEPLLRAILMCAVAEILAHAEVETPLLINDYLNICHSFYGQAQVSFVNGVLDRIAKRLRA